MEKIIENIGINIYPDYSKDIQDNILKFKDKFGIELIFCLWNGISIKYDADKYTPSKNKGKGDISFISTSDNSIVLYFIETLDTVEFRYFDDTVILKINKNND